MVYDEVSIGSHLPPLLNLKRSAYDKSTTFKNKENVTPCIVRDTSGMKGAKCNTLMQLLLQTAFMQRHAEIMSGVTGTARPPALTLGLISIVAAW